MSFELRGCPMSVLRDEKDVESLRSQRRKLAEEQAMLAEMQSNKEIN
jgi:hypothetical protein